MNKRLLNVGLVVLIDMLGFALIVPLLAFYADAFGATEFQTGLLVSSYAAMQMIGAGSFNALINSAISKSVTPEEVGGMLGFGAGLESATRVVMPNGATYYYFSDNEEFSWYNARCERRRELLS